jgi:hypothetical protein
MKFRLSLLALFVAIAPIFAADPPAPTPEPPVSPGVTVPLNATGVPGEWILVPFTIRSGGTPEFRILESGLAEIDLSKLFPDDVAKKATAHLFKASQPGTYHVEVRNANASVLSPIATVTINVVPVNVNPNPIPGPINPNPTPVNPNPGPSPPVADKTAQHLFVIIIEDMVKRTPQQGAVMYDKDFRQWMLTSGHKIEIYSKGDKDLSPTLAQFAAQMQSLLPIVIVLDADASGTQKPLKSFTLPATGADLEAMLKNLVSK